MDKLPPLSRGTVRSTIFKSLLATILVAVVVTTSLGFSLKHNPLSGHKIPVNAAQIVQQCKALHVLPGPPKDFHQRQQSDRYAAGTPPTLLRNATIWTGRVSGYEVVTGDVLIDKGIIQEVGRIKESSLEAHKGLVVIDAGGAWVTPGIVDMHSHLGVDSVPELQGSDDTNSIKGLTMPWLRSIDGLNTHDDAYQLSISGGITTANVLPGSANAIGGQAFTIKLRPTAERSTSAMVLEAPFTLNGTHVDASSPPRWRQMKHACGENPSRVYKGTRMDTMWSFRHAYDTARKLKEKQDAYCTKALHGHWDGLGDFPEDLQWEALVDVLRGRVKVHNHCYEAVDLDGMVRLTNEFKFSIAAFHHAHETYLVPDLLKKAYGKTPAIAVFATNARYKREAYRGSEFAPAILAQNGLDVVMKSDHPVLNSRHLLYEAQQAHYYGLPENLALASVTSTPATVLGYDHRIGFVTPGYDADLVVWDSHPLALGATPKQVYIDGIAQLKTPYVTSKPAAFQKAPKTPDFSKEAKEALDYDGLPPLEPKRASDSIKFTNVKDVYLRDGESIRESFSAASAGDSGVVLVDEGVIKCVGTAFDCPVEEAWERDVIDLEGGSISPSLISYGSHLGLHHIDGEASTNDGKVYDPLKADAPAILGENPVIRAYDGLQYSTRDALLAYRAGVTVGITAPSSNKFLAGLSTAFNTGSPHKASDGAIIQQSAALHLSIDSSTPSVSTHIAALRNILSGNLEGDLGSLRYGILDGSLPLVIQVESANIMATLIQLKKETDDRTGGNIRLTFAGASEAHLLAKEIGEAGVGVILNPSRPFPGTWKSRRILPGPPLTEQNAFATLLAHNVTVGLGIQEQWSARNTRFDVAWAAIEAHGAVSREQAVASVTTNLERLLGVNIPNRDLIAVKKGSLFDYEGKVAAVISPEQKLVHLIV